MYNVKKTKQNITSQKMKHTIPMLSWINGTLFFSFFLFVSLFFFVFFLNKILWTKICIFSDIKRYETCKSQQTFLIFFPCCSTDTLMYANVQWGAPSFSMLSDLWLHRDEGDKMAYSNGRIQLGLIRAWHKQWPDCTRQADSEVRQLKCSDCFADLALPRWPTGWGVRLRSRDFSGVES